MTELRDGTTVEDPRLGRLEQLDERSRAYAIGPIVAKAKAVTRTWRLTTVLNQGAEGACAGAAFTHELIAEPVTVNADMVYARTLYHEAQRLDPYPGGEYPGATPRMIGTSILSVVKILQARGLIPVYRWAFGLEDWQLAVSTQGPVILGCKWFEGMKTPDPQGNLKATGRVLGGHAICVIGVDMERGAFLLHNSWGPTWGARGRAWLPFADALLLRSYGAEVCVPTRRNLPTRPA